MHFCQPDLILYFLYNIKNLRMHDHINRYYHLSIISLLYRVRIYYDIVVCYININYISSISNTGRL